MSKPKKHRRHRPHSLNRCWCKAEKLLGRRTIQERRAAQGPRWSLAGLIGDF